MNIFGKLFLSLNLLVVQFNAYASNREATSEDIRQSNHSLISQIEESNMLRYWAHLGVKDYCDMNEAERARLDNASRLSEEDREVLRGHRYFNHSGKNPVLYALREINEYRIEALMRQQLSSQMMIESLKVVDFSKFEDEPTEFKIVTENTET